MEFLGAIALLLAALVLLAAVGLTTIVAFALMAALGIVTEMSFKRLFFISFGLGLLAPILLGGMTVGALQDESFQREISGELRNVLPSSESVSEDLGRVLPELNEIRRGAEDGTMEPEEIERRLEELFPERQTQVNGDAVRALIESETQPSEPVPTGDQ